jgi:hypothetical protein
MLELDHKFLQEVGLGHLSPGPASLVLGYLGSVLESRVRRRLAAGLSADELGEVEAIDRSGDDVVALAWLEEVRPHYGEIVWTELLRLRREVSVQVAFLDRSIPGLPHTFRPSLN